MKGNIKYSKQIKLSPVFVALVAFCFSMTIGVFWDNAIIVKNIKETQIITEDGTIVIDGGYLDIGIHDTMKDLLVNFVGAVVFSFLGYLYILNRDKYKFATNFIPTKNE